MTQSRIACPDCHSRTALKAMTYDDPKHSGLMFLRCYGCGWESTDAPNLSRYSDKDGVMLMKFDADRTAKYGSR